MSKANKNVAAAAAVAMVAATSVASGLDVYPTDEQMRKDGMLTLSARIRHLKSLGATTSQITKIVKRENGAHPLYQHVRNVLNTQLKGAAEASVSTPATTPATTETE